MTSLLNINGQPEISSLSFAQRSCARSALGFSVCTSCRKKHISAAVTPTTTHTMTCSAARTRDAVSVLGSLKRPRCGHLQIGTATDTTTSRASCGDTDCTNHIGLNSSSELLLVKPRANCNHCGPYIKRSVRLNSSRSFEKQNFDESVYK